MDAGRFPTVRVNSQAELWDWLAAHSASADSVWLAVPRKGQPGHFEYPELVKTLLCWGWIDSLPRALDDTHTCILASPRKPKSLWSEINRAHVAELERDGHIQPAGQAKIDQARADGSWDRLAEVDGQRVPPDFAAALAEQPGAREFFDGLPKSARRAALEWIVTPIRPETRAARIAQASHACAEGCRPR
jgi:uncharacterized protein YdeI (YjbR/CyaY-like superfamily)